MRKRSPREVVLPEGPFARSLDGGLEPQRHLADRQAGKRAVL